MNPERDNPTEVTRPPTRWLRLSRPHPVDLILTKMMRGNDPQDMQDIAFLIRQGGVNPEEMEAAFASVRIPDIQGCKTHSNGLCR